MFKCNAIKSYEPLDESNHRLLQFLFVSLLLYRNVFETVTSDARQKRPDVSLADLQCGKFLDMPELDDLSEEEFSSPDVIETVYQALKSKRREFEANPPELSENLSENLKTLADVFNLSEAEQVLMAFLALTVAPISFSLFNLLEAVHNSQNKQSSFRQVTANFLASISDCSADEFYRALSPQGNLCRNSLIRLDNMPSDYEDYVRIESGLADSLLDSKQSIQELLSQSLVKSQEGTLQLEDFTYLEPALPLLVTYLKNAHENKKIGVNVLLYGPPGTGKTELSRAIAKTLDAELYEVPVSGQMDANKPFKSREMALTTSLSLLKNNSHAFLVYDEAQDFFKNGRFEDLLFKTVYTTGVHDKGTTNKFLETNPVPMIWITNSIEAMDPAYLRRFDFCLEVGVPPLRQREKIITKKAGHLLLESGVRSIAERADIAPALIDRTAKVISEIKGPKEALQKHFITHLNASLCTMGKSPVEVPQGIDSAEFYDPAFSTADVDLTQITQGLKEATVARLCLYGVPGTGKTAWANDLGKQLGKRVIVKRCSDLLNCYLGLTEKQIAEAFREAKSENAILVIDEADSFLQKRSSAHHSWEVTQVNEMLTQIEHFEGIFIATTNALDAMDEACLRRFDLKIKFDYLDSEKAKALFKRYCDKLFRNQPVEAVLLNSVGTLRSLAPGDFATVFNQSRFNPLKTPEEFLHRLEKECHIKNAHSHQRAIGFSIS